MKSYTDLEQSKRLAEILPIESADMSYSFNFNSETYESSTVPYKDWIVPKYAQPDDGFGQVIPCWSLAALLELMPKEINALGTIYSINIHTKNEKWLIDYKCNNEEFVGVYSNIFLDACYEMILKLNELNLL